MLTHRWVSSLESSQSYKNEAKVIKPGIKEKNKAKKKNVCMCVFECVYVFIPSELYWHVQQTPIHLHKYTFVRRLLNCMENFITFKYM